MASIAKAAKAKNRIEKVIRSTQRKVFPTLKQMPYMPLVIISDDAKQLYVGMEIFTPVNVGSELKDLSAVVSKMVDELLAHAGMASR